MTIVIRNRLHLFGKVIDGNMVLNKFGEIAAKEWLNTLKLRDNVSLGAFMIMPDHIHFVIHIEEQSIQKEYTAEELERRAGAVAGKHMNKPGSLGSIVRGYKGAVTRQVLSIISENQNKETALMDNKLVDIHDQLRTEKTIWIRNYNEAIIRTQRHYDNVTRYINDNPKKWDENLRQKLDLD